MWTFLDEAREPSRVTPGALVVAGDEDACAVCQVAGLVQAADGTIVHLRLLPGVVDDYRALVDRARASQPLLLDPQKAGSQGLPEPIAGRVAPGTY